jgi:hypothetical protein
VTISFEDSPVVTVGVCKKLGIMKSKEHRHRKHFRPRSRGQSYQGSCQCQSNGGSIDIGILIRQKGVVIPIFDIVSVGPHSSRGDHMHTSCGEQWLFITTALKFQVTHLVCCSFPVRDSIHGMLYLCINCGRI